MPRNKKERCCRILETARIFKPVGIPLSQLEIIEIEVDELEAVRLCDYEGKSQIETAEIMKISRGTVQRLLNTGRKKIMDGLLHIKGIKLKNAGQEMILMGAELLRVGFPTNDGVTVEEHFGHCEKFAVYTIEEGKIVKKEILTAPEHAPGVFPRFIAENNINVVITGGMGQRAIDLIKGNGGQVILGASGNIEDVLAVYLEGSLYSKGSACVHHHHDHDEEGHNCGH